MPSTLTETRQGPSAAFAASNRAVPRRLRGALAGALLLVLLGAVQEAGAQVCTYNTPPGAITFTPFDPSVATTQTAQTTVTVRCTASGSPIWQFSSANGGAQLLMKHATQNAFIPYTAAASFVSQGGGNQRWNVTLTVLGQDYQNALVGSYSDLLTISITP